jgi:LmbE family N-acetylglucosaminyl deacetylase
MIDPKKILIISPHTDDGELGCGGAISKFSRNNIELYYAAFSTCRKSLPQGLPPDTLIKECNAAIQVLGIAKSNLELFDFDVREFPSKRQEILEELINLNKKIQPDLVFIPSASDMHQDHKVIHEEALRAFKYCSLLGYELPWNQSHFNTGMFIRFEQYDMERKIQAIACYHSQSHRNYTSGEFIRSLAIVRGVQCQSQFAEAFEVYRLIDGL